VPTFPGQELRRSKRVATKKHANLVVNLGSEPEKIPCLIMDISTDGFRLRTTYTLRLGQTVEVIANEKLNPVLCRVVWIGESGSKYEGQAGLQTVPIPH
jgi:hypothetical protein